MKTLRWLLPGAAIFALMMILFPEPELPSPLSLPLPVDDIAPDEDAVGRRHWEWMIQRDPVTGRIPADIHRLEQAQAALLPQRTSAEAPGGLRGRSADKVDNWAFRGPWNIGGRTRALAIDHSDPTYQTLLAGGVSGGMWRTIDDGQNWNLTTGSSVLHSVSCVVQDTRPGHGNTWYYGTGEGRGYSTSRGGGLYLGDGIFKSIDGGQSWSLLASTATGLPQTFDNPFNYVWRMVIDHTNLEQNVVYAATAGVIYRSLDGGQSWSPVLGSEADPSFYADLAISPEGVLYATLSAEGAVSGIFRSIDGLQWTSIGPNLMPGYGRITLGISPSNEDFMYFLVADPESSVNFQFWRYVYLDGDGSGSGGAWDNRTAPLETLLYPYEPAYGYIYRYVSQRGYNMLVTVHPWQTNTVFVGGVNLWRNTQGWSSTSTTLRVGGYYYEDRSHHADVHKLIYQPGSHQVAYSASDGGVHKTLDLDAAPVQWQSLNNGLNTTQFFTVALDPELPGNNVIIGGTQDNGTLWTSSADSESPWIEAFGGDGAHCAVLDGSATGDYLVSYYRANMFRVQLGPSGEMLAEGRINPVPEHEYLFINPFLTDPEREEVVYLASNNGVLRNSDVTAIPLGSWDPTNQNWEQLTSEPAGDFVSALGANGQPGHSLYYGTATGRLYRVDDALNSAAGISPVRLDQNGGFPAESYVSDIVVHPADDQTVLVTLGNYLVPSIWLTRDGGQTWTDVEGNLAGDDGPSVRCAAVMPVGNEDLWLLGTSTGLYSTILSEDEPVIWTGEAADIIGNVIVADLAVRLSDRKVVVGTHGRGIFSVTIPGPSDVPETLSGIHLARNYPNPFNPITTIRFRLEKAEPTRLEIFDLAGRRVRVLLDEKRSAGDHEIQWDGRNTQGRTVSSGVYFYRLETPSGVRQEKMTLLE
jgi:photosystem II stability/assembly factor-like uncharacterized protein|nr:FlgD immunoglobulin-like domain containing protein [Candidatus Krumholzibacteria bacterium]